MEQELGISPDSLSTDDFHFMTKMRYSARMNETWIEREVDHILVAKVDVELKPNPNEVSEVAWVTFDELEEMLIEENPQNGSIALGSDALQHSSCPKIGGMQQETVQH